MDGPYRPDPVEFAEAMNLIVEGGSELKNELGKNGRRRVLNNFAFNAFANKLNGYVDQVMESWILINFILNKNNKNIIKLIKTDYFVSFLKHLDGARCTFGLNFIKDYS